jgi:DNA-binding IscR family transcriptional regulator
VLSHFLPEGTSSVTIARSLATNPVVVRRLLKDLAIEGLVRMQPGRNGGVQLAVSPDTITLDAVRRAVEGDAGVFAIRPGGNPRCPVNKVMPGLLAPVLDAVNGAVSETLSRTTIASLVRQMPARAVS